MNPKNLKPHEWLRAIAVGELTVIQDVVQDSTDPTGGTWVTCTRPFTARERLDAAKAAAPYYAPRLASQTIVQKSEEETMTDTELEAAAKKLLAKIGKDPKVLDVTATMVGKGYK
jgi:hypothetical protein